MDAKPKRIVTLVPKKPLAHQLEAKTEDIRVAENLSFADLMLSQPVLKGLETAGFKHPSPIQAEAIPLGRFGLDLVVQAKSGTGKTCVFAVVSLETVALENLQPQVIIICPTREIAEQSRSAIASIGAALPTLKTRCFIGGTDLKADQKAAGKCHIAVGTPGRLCQLVNEKHISLDHIRLMVLDEADQLMNESFQKDITWLYQSAPEKKQLIVLSATYPDELKGLLASYMRTPQVVQLNAEDVQLVGLKQYYTVVECSGKGMLTDKLAALNDILSRLDYRQCLIFCSTQKRAEDVNVFLESKEIPSGLTAGNLDQKSRSQVMKEFKAFQLRVLVSTDLLARGIDSSHTNLVINFDVPETAETYFHRIGRAGRYGGYGAALSLVMAGDKNFYQLAAKNRFHLKLLPNPIPIDLAEDSTLYKSLPDVDFYALSGGSSAPSRPVFDLGALRRDGEVDVLKPTGNCKVESSTSKPVIFSYTREEMMGINEGTLVPLKDISIAESTNLLVYSREEMLGIRDAKVPINLVDPAVVAYAVEGQQPLESVEETATKEGNVRSELKVILSYPRDEMYNIRDKSPTSVLSVKGPPEILRNESKMTEEKVTTEPIAEIPLVEPAIPSPSDSTPIEHPVPPVMVEIVSYPRDEMLKIRDEQSPAVSSVKTVRQILPNVEKKAEEKVVELPAEPVVEISQDEQSAVPPSADDLVTPIELPVESVPPVVVDIVEKMSSVDESEKNVKKPLISEPIATNVAEPPKKPMSNKNGYQQDELAAELQAHMVSHLIPGADEQRPKKKAKKKKPKASKSPQPDVPEPSWDVVQPNIITSNPNEPEVVTVQTASSDEEISNVTESLPPPFLFLHEQLPILTYDTQVGRIKVMEMPSDSGYQNSLDAHQHAASVRFGQQQAKVMAKWLARCDKEFRQEVLLRSLCTDESHFQAVVNLINAGPTETETNGSQTEEVITTQSWTQTEVEGRNVAVSGSSSSSSSWKSVHRYTSTEKIPFFEVGCQSEAQSTAEKSSQGTSTPGSFPVQNWPPQTQNIPITSMPPTAPLVQNWPPQNVPSTSMPPIAPVVQNHQMSQADNEMAMVMYSNALQQWYRDCYDPWMQGPLIQLNQYAEHMSKGNGNR